MNDLISEVFRDQSLADSLSDAGWELLVRQGRTAMVMGTLGYRIASHGRSPKREIMRHFESAQSLSTAQQVTVRWELQCIERALQRVDTPVIVLKGAAYAAANLPAAAGRLMSDVDIMVPKDRIADVEDALVRSGWIHTDTDPYDQHYYRTWMHELPPMRHRRRGTTIDVHHSILPETARLHPRPDLLFAAAQVLASNPRFKVLAPADMVLHSATHLFHDGELEHGFRDLVDIDALLRHFASIDGFWEHLAGRSVQLDLARPLFYALRFAKAFLNTPIPHSVIATLDGTPNGAPGILQLKFADAIFTRALRPAHASASDYLTPFARWLAYVRAHWLRMPPHLLAYHLAHKAVFRPKMPSKV